MSQKNHFFVCTNPYSGAGKGIKALQQVSTLFKQAHIEASYTQTQHPGHGKHILQALDLSQYSGIIIIGGDGSIHDAINGLLNNPQTGIPPLGFVPAGSGNSLMHDLNCLSSTQAVKTILKGNTASLDILALQLDDQLIYSFNVTGWGLITDIGMTAEKMRWLGSSRYTICTLIELLRLQFRDAEITLNGKTTQDSFTFISLCNTKHTGKAMCIAPKAQLDDGLVDCLMIKQTSRLTLLKFFPQIFSGAHLNAPILNYQQIKTLQLKPKYPMNLLVDGEILENIQQLALTVLPKKLHYFL
jgi:YegS/Rv2252/BmrU family lipid kinase